MIRIGTRGSALAVKQTEMFIAELKKAHPGIECETVVISTKGDIDLETPLDQMGGFGAFVRELNNALTDNRIDVSINSLKDMPVIPQEGVTIGAVMERGPVTDVILPKPIKELPSGCVVGTSSVRRAAMLRRLRPDIVTAPIRGNVTTRLRKLDEGEYGAVILAEAGLRRLGIGEGTSLSLNDFPPAPGQGAIAAACRIGDKDTLRLLAAVDHVQTRHEVTAERKLMRLLGADCSAPVGILASCDGDALRIRALAVRSDGSIWRQVDERLPDDSDTSLQPLADILKEAF